MKEQLRVAFATFGCRSNYADTVELQAALVEQGAIPCDFNREADVYVVNTCTVTDSADREAYKLLRTVRARSPHARIVVTGCLAEIAPKELREATAADAVIGPGQKRLVLDAVLNRTDLATNSTQRRGPQRAPLDERISPAIPAPGVPFGELKPRSRYHLRIQEGCENSCTFCIIPRTRGPLSSRPVLKIVEDLNYLADRGYHEVVLTGTHLGGYGIDLGCSLKELLRALAARSPVHRLRLSSIDPNDIDREIIDILAESDVFCEHLHICVQAFSDRLLKRMNRRYRLVELSDLVGYAAEKIHGCAIGGDLITGFPGESREEVEQAMKLFLELPFSYLHIFPYSERSGTAATRLDQPVDSRERKRRAARWRAVAARKKEQYLRGLIGSELEVVLEHSGSAFLQGTSRQYTSVKLSDGKLSEPGTDVAEDRCKPKLRAGELTTVRAFAYDSTDGRLLCA